MLNLIGKSLSDNGVSNSFVKGNVWSRNSAISKFKLGKDSSGEDNKVIMLSLSNSASGTNLTEATHIIFVEPINSNTDEMKAIEGQAIGRACRLGQENKVKVMRILPFTLFSVKALQLILADCTPVSLNAPVSSFVFSMCYFHCRETPCILLVLFANASFHLIEVPLGCPDTVAVPVNIL